MIIAGSDKTLVSKVVTAATGLPTTSGVNTVLVWRESDGYFWDGSSWISSGVNAGTPAHKIIGNWEYVLSGVATTAITNDIIFYDMSDSLTAASITLTVAGGEHKIRTENPLSQDTVASGVWGALLTNHTIADSFGEFSQQGVVITGAGVSTAAESYTLTTGTESANSYTDTFAVDDVVHQHTDTGNALDLYYQFDIGGDGLPTSTTITGRINGGNDDLDGIYAYNWAGASWDRIGAFDGQAGSTNVERSYNLLIGHVGTSTNKGKVRIRPYAAAGLTSATLSIDQIICSYAVASRTVGYADGAVWVNTNASNINTELYVDGTADNPVSTWAAAQTIGSALTMNRYRIAADSTITLDSSSVRYTLIGESWVLALNGQDIAGASITGADVSGIGTSSDGHPHFHHCDFGTVTLPAIDAHDCGFGVGSGIFTAGAAGDYVFHNSFSQVAGMGSPSFIFSGLGSATSINNRSWTGGATWTLDSDCTISHEPLAGGGTTFTTGGANVEIRGITRSITLHLSGAGTAQFVGITGPITIDGTATTTINLYGVSSSLADTSSGTTVNDFTNNATNISTLIETTLTSSHGAGTWTTASGFSTHTVSGVWNEVLNKASYDINQSAGKRLRQHTDLIIHEGTAQGPGMNGNQIELAANASALDGAYDPALVVLVGGTGEGQSRAILQYDGTTKIAVTDRSWKVNPDTTTDYLILAYPGREHVNEGLLQSATVSGATLNALASSNDDEYIGQALFIRSGLGEDQVRHVHSYNGATKYVEVTPNWATTPDGTSGYVMLAQAIPLDDIAAEVEAVLSAAHGSGSYDTTTVSGVDVNVYSLEPNF